MGTQWTRWQDWGAVVLGIVAGVAVVWLDATNAAAWTDAALWSLLVFGVLLLASGLWSLTRPDSVASEYVHIGLGVLLFISPWVLDYATVPAAAWTSWVVGALAVLVGVAAIPMATTAHRMAGQH